MKYISSYEQQLESIELFITTNRESIDKDHDLTEFIQLTHIVKGWLVIHMQISLRGNPQVANDMFWYWSGFYGWLYLVADEGSAVADITYESFKNLLLGHHDDVQHQLPIMTTRLANKLLYTDGELDAVKIRNRTDDMGIILNYIGTLLANSIS